MGVILQSMQRLNHFISASGRLFFILVAIVIGEFLTNQMFYLSVGVNLQ